MADGESNDDGRAFDATVVPMSNPGLEATVAPRSSLSPSDPARDATVYSEPPPSSQGTAQGMGQRSTAEAEGGSFPVVLPSVYTIERELARGGMGRVLVARDRRLARDVALKELLVQREDLAARFAREALITARLQHPSIVPIYEAGQWPSGERFYAMKLVAGKPLDQVVAATQTVRERVALVPAVIAIGDALAYAHQHHVIHRDLKPQNILVGEFGETILVDWGVAKDLAAPDDEAPGMVVGTPAYMPPEQALGELVDERADVYSLGAVLYHVLAKRPPFEGKSTAGVLAEVVSALPTPLATLVPDVPSELATIVAKAMHRDPELRYPNAGRLVEDLRRFQTGKLVAVHHYSFGELARRWVRKYRGVLAVTAIAVVVVLAGGVYAVRQILAANRRAIASMEVAKHEASNTIVEMHKVEDKNAELLVETGRREWIDGHLQRAARDLAEAYAHLGPSHRVVSLLAGLVERGLDEHGVTLPVVADERMRVYFVAGTHEVIVDDGEVRSFDLTTGARVARQALAAGRRLVGVSRDGHTLLTESPNHDFVLWHDDRPTPSVPSPGGTPDRTAFSTTGQQWAAYADGVLRIGSAQTLQVLHVPEQPCRDDPKTAWAATSVVCDAACEHVAIGGPHCGFVVDLLATPRPMFTKLPADGTYSLTLTSDGERVVAIAADPGHGYTAYVGFASNPGSSIETDPTVQVMAMVPGRILLADYMNGVRVFDATGEWVSIPTVAQFAFGGGISDDGQRALVTTDFGMTELHTKQPKRLLQTYDGDDAVFMAPDGTAAVIGATALMLPRADVLPSANARATILQFSGGELVTYHRDADAPSVVESLAGPSTTGPRVRDLSPDGTRALQCADATCAKLVVVERTSGRVLGTFPESTAIWFGTNDWIVMQAADGVDTIAPVTGGAPQRIPQCHSDKRSQFWMTPDAEVVACNCGDDSNAGCGLAIVDRAHPNARPHIQPCDFANHPYFTSQRPDSFVVHLCGRYAHIFGRDGSAHCEAGRVEDTTDGTRCVRVDGGRVVVSDYATNQPVVTFGSHIELAVERRGIVYTLDDHGTVGLWDREHGSLLGTHVMLNETGSMEGFGVSDDGSIVVIADDYTHRERWIVPFETRAPGLVAANLRAQRP